MSADQSRAPPLPGPRRCADDGCRAIFWGNVYLVRSGFVWLFAGAEAPRRNSQRQEPCRSQRLDSVVVPKERPTQDLAKERLLFARALPPLTITQCVLQPRGGNRLCQAL